MAWDVFRHPPSSPPTIIKKQTNEVLTLQTIHRKHQTISRCTCAEQKHFVDCRYVTASGSFGYAPFLHCLLVGEMMITKFFEHNIAPLKTKDDYCVFGARALVKRLTRKDIVLIEQNRWRQFIFTLVSDSVLFFFFVVLLWFAWDFVSHKHAELRLCVSDGLNGFLRIQ